MEIYFARMEICCARLCKNGDQLCKAVQEWRSTVQGCARMEINCAKLCMLFIVQIRMEMTVQSCARMEIYFVRMEICCARLCMAVHGCARMEMGVVHDVIDCYDITEVPMMSFVRFRL